MRYALDLSPTTEAYDGGCYSMSAVVYGLELFLRLPRSGIGDSLGTLRRHGVGRHVEVKGR